MDIHVHPAAEAEARETFIRYREADPAVAARFISALDDAMVRVSDGPERWPTYLLGTRRVLLRRFPFAIVYRVDPGRVLILAIAHQKRRPGYWRHRKR